MKIANTAGIIENGAGVSISFGWVRSVDREPSDWGYETLTPA